VHGRTSPISRWRSTRASSVIGGGLMDHEGTTPEFRERTAHHPRDRHGRISGRRNATPSQIVPAVWATCRRPRRGVVALYHTRS